jgi:hypothetical protein
VIKSSFLTSKVENMANAHEQRLNEITAQEKKLADEKAKLLAATRTADLETVKSLIKLHGFSPTELRSVLKAKRKRKAGGNASRKTPATPRKSTAAKNIKSQSKSKANQ